VIIDEKSLLIIGLYFIKGIGSKMLKTLLKISQDPADIISLSAEKLLKIPRLNQEIAQGIQSIKLEKIEQLLNDLNKKEIKVITFQDQIYPKNLAAISDLPPVLFYSGNFSDNVNFAVAIVGSRNASVEGVKKAMKLAKGLAKRGFIIVSGLAKGIDTAAHQGALKANGKTFAVLGSGIKFIYPSKNKQLANKITQSGALFSELHPNTLPSGHNLMRRDRIISGLGLATIVVESELESGSIDTAERTIKQKRLLFAVENQSAGNQLLLRGKANPITDISEKSLDDIADKLNKTKIRSQSEDIQTSFI